MNAQKLSQIQSKLKAPKGQYNKFGGYKYRSCEDICEAVKPIIAEMGIALTLQDEIVAIGDRIYVKATATLMDEEGIISSTAFAREEDSKKGMDGAQVTGSASSYARKYALNGLLCTDDTKDPDATNTGENTQNQKPASKPQQKKVAVPDPYWEYKNSKSIEDLCAERGINPQAIWHYYGIASPMEMTVDRYAHFNQNTEYVLNEVTKGGM